MVRKAWTKEEIKFLEENFDKMIHADIAKALGRKPADIRVKLSKLKLIKKPRREKIKKGDRFGKLVVIGPIQVKQSGRTITKYECECDCSKCLEEKKIVQVKPCFLRDGSTTSCGCYRKEMSSIFAQKHGLHKKFGRLLNRLRQMHERCYNPNRKAYKDYGGRGIKICDEWNINIVGRETAYKNFIDWALKNGYQDNLTIDRINNDGNYDPNNCRWITQKQQNLNRRSNILLTAFNETKTLLEWSEDIRCKPNYFTLYARIKNKWEHEKAITTIARSTNSSTYIGVSKTKMKWISYIRISNQLIVIGKFNTEKEAAEKRDKYVIENNLIGHHINLPENEKAPEDNSPEA